LGVQNVVFEVLFLSIYTDHQTCVR